MSKVVEKTRCAVCGAEIGADDATFRIQHKTPGQPLASWGKAHEACFLKRMGGPRDVLQVIQARARRIVEGAEAAP